MPSIFKRDRNTLAFISPCFFSNAFIASATCATRTSDRVEWSWAVLSIEVMS